ncbi:hypothetical protein [Roseateles sp.]|uniref:hypothetical protein n=1 Tax=Roseateles sp. TaxID=1971397 RepID=UPI0025D5BA5E|nr:hypothetical protein [Roseateles sp.]MBV8035316.1 hypothetical protein [Roseateles sp.]
MQFPKSSHAEGWHEQLADLPLGARDTDSVSPPLRSRRLHALAIVAVATLGASAGLNLVDDPRPLDVQLSAAMDHAGETLQQWQAQLSRGLQVSLRAVADTREPPAAESTVVAQAPAASQPVADEH